MGARDDELFPLGTGMVSAQGVGREGQQTRREDGWKWEGGRGV